MIDELLADRSAEFPVTRTRTFLAHAAFSPLPARVAAAIGAAAQELCERGQGSHVEDRIERSARQSAAALLGCADTDIAFTANTSTGMSLLAGGMQWRTGGNIVLARGDFPAVINPWRVAAERHGIEVRYADVDAQNVLAAADDRTAAVVMSTVNFASGERAWGLREAARQLRCGGVFVIVDAIQTLGTEPFGCDDFDAVLADGHKWLLAPKGAALFYCAERLAEVVTPPVVGWRNMVGDRPYAAGGALRSGAARFEAGSLNVIGLAGLDAAVRLLSATGLEVIRGRIDKLGRLIRDVLRRHRMVASTWEVTSPLLCVPVETHRGRVLYEHLERAGISISLRQDIDKRLFLRIAPHFYNDETDVQRLDAALERLP